jgi:hypothetical protein
LNGLVQVACVRVGATVGLGNTVTIAVAVCVTVAPNVFKPVTETT